MKVSIIGGGGRVGSNAAFALQMGSPVREIVLIDVAREAAEGEALDLRHGLALASPQLIKAGDYSDAAGSDIVIITAGLRRKPDESRLELINRNVALFKQILGELKNIGLSECGILLVVSNPVDILTQIAIKEAGLPTNRVIGLGTVLDTVRFRSLLSEMLGVAASQVNALILGEHGDSMVPIWSAATANGVPISCFPNYSEEKASAVFQATKKAGAEAIRLKGGAGYAVGLSIRQVVNAIALDSREVLPVSTLQTGLFGINGVCLSVPTIVGRQGVVSHIEIGLSSEETEMLKQSGLVLAETMSKIS